MRKNLTIKNLNLYFDQRVIFDSVNLTLETNDRVGLVGQNGSGKTTLLKIIAGSTQAKGNIKFEGKVSYIPQYKAEEKFRNLKVSEYISGYTDEWWLVLIELEKIFGLSLDPNSSLAEISGGEVTKLLIATALSQKPDLLLLDEPTNHLDHSSVLKLEEILSELKIPYIVASHNISFLNNCVNKIWEIKDHKVNVYGGNYDFYVEQKNAKQESIKREREAKEKKLKKTISELQKEQQKSQKSQAKLTKMAKSRDRSIPKIILGGLKMKGQIKHGENKGKLKSSIENLSAEVDSLKQTKRSKIYLETQSENRKGLLISIHNGFLKVENKLLLEEINFSLYAAERIAIYGDNGTGKTTFIKNLEFQKSINLQGEVNYGKEYKTMFIDQTYSNVDEKKNLIDNLLEANKHLNYEEVRKHLANLGFKDEDDIKLKALTLSGGETARLCFAMAIASKIDLLIMDEPTNNLDIETVDWIADALQDFKGSIVLVTHDYSFAEKIKIQKVFEIKDQKLLLQ